jgi:hypothetical protein
VIGAEPCEFQFAPTTAPLSQASPSAAAYVDCGKNSTSVATSSSKPAANRGGQALHTLRLAAEYVNGKSIQNEFYNNFEQRYGLGVLYDFYHWSIDRYNKSSSRIDVYSQHDGDNSCGEPVAELKLLTI